MENIGENKTDTEEAAIPELSRAAFWRSELLYCSVTLSDRIIFTRRLAAMVKAGLPLSRALAVLGKQSSKPAMRETVRALAVRISRGESLHEAFAASPRVFSPLFVAVVGVGEESGTLPEALLTISSHLKDTYDLEKRVRTALVYPAVIVVAIILVAVIMLLYVVPVLSATFQELGVELPFSTRLVIGVSTFLHESLALVLALFAGALFCIAGISQMRWGKRLFDFFILHVPLISPVVKEVNAARTARTLSSLLSAGIPILETLRVTEEVLQNSYYRGVVRNAHEDVAKGAPLSRVFTQYENLYPPLFSEMVAVGEETGKLSTLLGETAEFYEEEVERATRDMSAVLEPFLMVAIGVAVGFFALAMITPMYSLVNSI